VGDSEPLDAYADVERVVLTYVPLVADSEVVYAEVESKGVVLPPYVPLDKDSELVDA
jgi:hypothetical protein